MPQAYVAEAKREQAIKDAQRKEQELRLQAAAAARSAGPPFPQPQTLWPSLQQPWPLPEPRALSLPGLPPLKEAQASKLFDQAEVSAVHSVWPAGSSATGRSPVLFCPTATAMMPGADSACARL